MDEHGKLITILSIDGGGIRGLIPAVALEHLEEELQKIDGKDRKIADYFDVIAGTSTGSIITGMLTVPDEHGNPRFKATDIISKYQELGPNVFSSTHKAVDEEDKSPNEEAAELAREAATKLHQAKMLAENEKVRLATEATGRLAKDEAVTLARKAANAISNRKKWVARVVVDAKEKPDEEVNNKEAAESFRKIPAENEKARLVQEAAGRLVKDDAADTIFDKKDPNDIAELVVEAKEKLEEAKGKDAIEKCREAEKKLNKAAELAKHIRENGSQTSDDLFLDYPLLTQAAHLCKEAADGLSNEVARTLEEASVIADKVAVFLDTEQKEKEREDDYVPKSLIQKVYKWIKKHKKIRKLVESCLNFSVYGTVARSQIPFETHARLQETVKDVVIPAFSFNNNRPYIFSSRMARTLSSDRGYQHIYLTDVILSSIAAPIYFKPYKFSLMGEEYSFLDGGLAANNPSLLALLEAGKLEARNGSITSRGNNKYLVVSLGTGRGSRSRGYIRWLLDFEFLKGNIIRVIMLLYRMMGGLSDMEEIYMSRFFWGKNVDYYLRVQDYDLENDAMDDATSGNIRKLKIAGMKLLSKTAMAINPRTGVAEKQLESNKGKLDEFARLLSTERTRRQKMEEGRLKNKAPQDNAIPKDEAEKP